MSDDESCSVHAAMKKHSFSICLLAISMMVTSPGQEARIVGGSPTTSTSQYPYMTALLERGAAPAKGQFCGASLVAPQWVLTAAHCLDGVRASMLEVWIGGRDLRNAHEGVRVRVTQIIRHPGYSASFDGSLQYDFALLKLARPVTERPPLALVQAASQITPGTTARVLGWGAIGVWDRGSHILKQVDLPLVSLETAGGEEAGLGPMHLAAGFPSGGADSCQGDSGGPLMVGGGPDWFHAGTVSYGEGCAFAGNYGIYGNTLTVKEWIESYIGPSAAPDDHGNTRALATYVDLNTLVPGVLEKPRDVDFFRIDVLSAGVLRIQSQGDTDVVGTLFNSRGTVLAVSGNRSGTLNFDLTRRTRAAATLFLRVSGRLAAATTGAYAFMAEFEPEAGAAPRLVVRRLGKPVAMGRTINFGSTTEGGWIGARLFTLANTGRAPLNILNAEIDGPQSASFKLVSMPSDMVPAGRSTSFVIECSPVWSGANAATLTLLNDDPLRSPFNLELAATGRPIPGDDYGNAIQTAHPVSIPLNLPGVINSFADLDFFAFTVTTAGVYTIKTTSTLDTMGSLFNSAGTLIGFEDDISPFNANFSMSPFLELGTYYICVEGYSRRDTGPYNLVITQD